MDELEKLKEHTIQAANPNFLFLDLSSSITGFCICSVDWQRKKVTFTKAGAIFLPDIDHVEKCGYIYNMMVNYFSIVEQIDYLVMEEYRINPKKMQGTMISIELHGSIKSALSELGLKFSYIPVQTWRSQLKIKKNEEGDFKQPTRDRVQEYVKLPEKVISNTTGNDRKCPSDLSDAIAVAMGFWKKMGLINWDFKGIKFQTHVGAINVKGEF